MTKQEKDKAFIRSAGEHYVLARIAKELAIPAGLAPENTKDIDILAIYPNCDSPIRIQVKTRTEGKSADNGWMMSQKHEEICDKDLFYVFVTLPEKWTDECQPKTYIMPAEKVAFYNRIDTGIFLCFLELCLDHEGYHYSKQLFPDEGMEAELTLNAVYTLEK